MDNPNFPPLLDINPSENNFADSDPFGFSSQKSAIQNYGIAGRVWEAAYTLTTYLESSDPQVEFDPPSPFLPRRRRPWSNPDSSREGCGRQSASGTSPCPDAGGVPKPLTILELGSGTGIIIARLAEIIHRDGCDTKVDDILIATDLGNVCPLLDENLSAVAKKSGGIDYPSPRVLVRPLEWGNLHHTLDISTELGPRPLTHIICSDLVYFPHLLAPLLRSLIHLTSLPPSSPQPSIIISYRIRSLPKEIPFWSAFGLWFSYDPALYRRSSQGNGDYESDRPPLSAHSNEDSATEWARYHAPSSTYIFVAHRRSVSLGWTAPEDDGDLLDGVGAHGDQRKKGDHAFELMLLMNLADYEG